MLIIFLDFDGVLSPYPYFARNQLIAPQPMKYLNNFIQTVLQFDIKVEICAMGAWAKLYSDVEIKFILENYGLPQSTLLKVTNINLDGIETKATTKFNYIVIDDEPTWGDENCIVKPDSKFGIQEEDYLKLLKLFKIFKSNLVEKD